MNRSASTRAPRRWIVSARFDLALVAIPFAGALASLLTVGGDGGAVPLWAFLLLIVATDVAHVWATAYITYLDQEVFRRRRLLFVLPVPLAFLIAYRLHVHSPQLYWTLLAYVAIYHFIQQQWGFIALYKARAGERRSFDYYLDKWTLWVGALGPVLLWHASPARQFDWFNAGESFIARINPDLQGDIVIIMGVFAALWLGRQIQIHVAHREINPGKCLWMTLSWISWSVGIGLADHPLISAAFINLFHGIPFLGLVWYRCNRRWQGASGGPSRLVAWLSQRRNWLWFLLPLWVFALAEETLWDGLVWQIYLPSLLDVSGPDLSLEMLSLWVALLSIPQIVHYYLDAWVWKLDGSNPDLRALLEL